MTGYQEIITDPSYFGQIVTMTAPMIGNYGISPEDNEASRPMASGLVVRELSPVVSNWRSRLSLGDYLRQNGIPGISEVDTRAITKKLRVDGAMKCCISTLPLTDADAIAHARAWQDIAGSDYVKDVTCAAPYVWSAEDPANHNSAYVPAGTTLGLPPPPPPVTKSPPSILVPSTPFSANSSATDLTSLCFPPRPPPRKSASTTPTDSSSPTARRPRCACLRAQDRD